MGHSAADEFETRNSHSLSTLQYSGKGNGRHEMWDILNEMHSISYELGIRLLFMAEMRKKTPPPFFRIDDSKKLRLKSV